MEDTLGRKFITGKNPATQHCFALAARSLLAAEIQVQRIWSEPVISEDNPILPYETKLIDIHFYFIALRNIYRYLDKIVSDPEYSIFELNLKKLNGEFFSHYSQGREAFEHIDQRFSGEKHSHKIEEIEEIEENGAKRKVHYGLKMKEGLFSHSNQTWDISYNKFDEMKNKINELLGLIEISSNKHIQSDPAKLGS